MPGSDYAGQVADANDGRQCEYSGYNWEECVAAAVAVVE